MTLPIALLFFSFIALVAAMVELGLNHERTSLFLLFVCGTLLVVAQLIPNP